MNGASSLPSDTQAAEARQSEQQFRVAQLVLFLVLGYLTVAGNLNSYFSTYDDVDQVVHNKRLLKDAGWGELFRPEPYMSQYVPVTWASFKLNYALFGRDAAWSFRAVNWLLHAASGWLLFGLMLHLGLTRFRALFVALAWTAHPMACESVAWITQRSNCLAFFFGVAGFSMYVKSHGEWRGILGGLAGFALAYLSKPAALGWFPILLAYEFLGGPLRLGSRESSSGVSNWAGAGIRVGPFVLLAGLCTWLGIRHHEFGLMPPPGGEWYTALLTDAEIFAGYLGNILAPVKLSAFYFVEEVAGFDDGRFYACALLLAAAVGATVWAARSRRRALFGWLWFFGGLAPNANLVAIVFLMQDRYVYLSSVGVLLVLVECVAGLRQRFFRPADEVEEEAVQEGPEAARKAALSPLGMLAGVYVLALAALTMVRSVTWESSYRLFEEATQRQPESGLAHIYFATQLDQAAMVLTQKRQGQEAHKNYAEIVRQLTDGLAKKDAYRYHDPFNVHLLLAKAAAETGKRELARSVLKGLAPPAAPPEGDTAGLKEQEIRNGFRVMTKGGHVYKYKVISLALAYLTLARTELDEFQDPLTPLKDSWESLERAEAWAEQARLLKPFMVDSYYLKAGVLLARDLLGDPAASGPAQEERAKAAKADWSKAEFNLKNFYFIERDQVERFYFSDHAPAKEDASQEAPAVLPERLGALGCLALAEAGLLESHNTEHKPEELRDLAQKALAWVEKAEELAPEFSEILWLKGRIHLRLSEIYSPKLQDPAAALDHFNRGKALWEKVPSTSPRHEQIHGEQGLRTLMPPPPPPKGAPKGPPPSKTESRPWPETQPKSAALAPGPEAEGKSAAPSGEVTPP